MNVREHTKKPVDLAFLDVELYRSIVGLILIGQFPKMMEKQQADLEFTKWR